MIEARRKNFEYFQSRLKDKIWFPKILDDTSTSSFAIPVILKDTTTRNRLISELEKNNIVCRPLIAGSMGQQPFYIKRYGRQILKNCHIIDCNGIYVPNHDKLSIGDIDRICNILIKY